MYHIPELSYQNVLLIIFNFIYPLLDVAAFPESINIIKGMDNDIRTPDKLVDGINDTKDGRHSWLAPILPGQVSKKESYLIKL